MQTQETINEAYDTLIHIAEEMLLSQDALAEEIKKLFPEFNNVGIYDNILGNYEIARYANARALGLSVKDAAHAAGVSGTVINNALKGRGVTSAVFVKLVKNELFAYAEMVVKLLTIVENAENNTSVNAAIALLEKIDPKKYGKQAGAGGEEEVKPGVNITFSVREEE